MGKQMVCAALLIFCAHLCSSHRWLIANCLVSFPVIKFSLSPMLTTLGSSSPVVQTGELSSGTWMLRGRRWMLSSCQLGLKQSWEEGAFLKCAVFNLNKIIPGFKNVSGHAPVVIQQLCCAFDNMVQGKSPGRKFVLNRLLNGSCSLHYCSENIL